MYNEQLCICITDTEPQQRREMLIKAIAAAMRWNAVCAASEKYNDDGDNLYTLAQLLEELAGL
jgi:hypothetical protein